MKKISLLFSALFILFLSACTNSTTQTTWEVIQQRGVLKVATPATLFPTSYYNDNNELVGYEIDMMNEIGKRLNITIEFVEIGVAEAFTSVDNKQVDVAVNNFDTTPERLEKYHFSAPYKYSVGGIIVRSDDSSGINNSDLSDWANKKAGGGAGTQYMKIAEALGATPVLYDNVTNDVYLRDVAIGRTDFIPNDYFTQVIAVKYITELYPDIKVKVSPTVFYNPTEQGIVMAKTDTSLKETIDKVIENMRQDGTLQAISEKYYDGQNLSVPLPNRDTIPIIDTSATND